MDPETTRKLKELIEGMEKEQDAIDKKSKTGPKKTRITISTDVRDLDKADINKLLETQETPDIKSK